MHACIKNDSCICSTYLNLPIVCVACKMRIVKYFVILTFLILVTSKCKLFQTVQTQIKRRIMRHFIRVFTVSFNKEIQFQLEIITCDTSICTMNYPKFNYISLKEESISDLGVKLSLQ